MEGKTGMMIGGSLLPFKTIKGKQVLTSSVSAEPTVEGDDLGEGSCPCPELRPSVGKA